MSLIRINEGFCDVRINTDAPTDAALVKQNQWEQSWLQSGFWARFTTSASYKRRQTSRATK